MSKSAALVFAWLACAALPAQAGDRYAIDPRHTFAGFEIDHFGFSTSRGRFDRTSGTLDFDAAQKTGAVDVTIEAASISTGVAALDEHLQGADFFDVAKYPKLRFVSREFVFAGDRLVAVAGDLAMHGVTRPVRLEVTRFACKVNPIYKVPACGADAEAVIRRSEWNIKTYLPGVGDDVRLRIQVEAHRRQGPPVPGP